MTLFACKRFTTVAAIITQPFVASHVNLVVCASTEPFSTGFTVIRKLSSVHLHVDIETAFCRERFATQRTHKPFPTSFSPNFGSL